MKKLEIFIAGMLFALTANAAVTFDWATVGDPGNAADPLNSGTTPGIGSVAAAYNIATKEVNLFQYTEFLNAVDPSGANTLGLYNSNLATDTDIAGIALNSGAAAGSKYAVIGSGNRPVTYVSWNDAARFVNWLQNGQGSGSTESGVYDMSLGMPSRSGSATYFIPSENEWYKAAYYQPVGQGGDTDSYWLYPTKSNTVPGNTMGSGANQANYDNWSLTLTDGGAFSGSASFYGTYDQGGNVGEWNDSVVFDSYRGLRGGNWLYGETDLRSSLRSGGDPVLVEDFLTGFRVASVPEPSAVGLVLLAGAGSILWKRRKTKL
jgi:formylglycine-generating enzyme required for sulfatase activity